jgi:transcriptional regulator with XRE-family HTH domain
LYICVQLLTNNSNVHLLLLSTFFSNYNRFGELKTKVLPEEKSNISEAIRSVLRFKRIKQSELAGILEITPQAVSQKMKSDNFNNQDISILNKSLGVDLIALANTLDGPNNPMSIVSENAAQYKSPSIFVTLTPDEAKQIMLNQSQTIEELRQPLVAIGTKKPNAPHQPGSN